MKDVIARSRSLWNRASFDLNSDEILAQLLDRGELDVWRELYRLSRTDPRLRERIKRIVVSVPTPLPHFWLVALAGLGEPIDWTVQVPDYSDSTTV